VIILRSYIGLPFSTGVVPATGRTYRSPRLRELLQGKPIYLLVIL